MKLLGFGDRCNNKLYMYEIPVQQGFICQLHNIYIWSVDIEKGIVYCCHGNKKVGVFPQ